MTTSQPGEVRGPHVADPRAEGPGGPAGRRGRRLAEPPSTRYALGGSGGDDGDGASIVGPLAGAALVGVAGAALLFVVGAVIASTVGLVFVCGVMGAGIGLILAGAAVAPDGGRAPLSRTAALRLALGMAIGAVIVADVATWLYALREGGTLGLFDYLLETFGPFVPGELIVAALAAVWGASSGPVRRR